MIPPREEQSGLQPASLPTELTVGQLRFHVTLPAQFTTTEELTPGHDFVGQERARAALELGVGITSSGYNIFVSGLTGAEKLEALRGWVDRHTPDSSPPLIGSTSRILPTPTHLVQFLSPRGTATA